MTDDELRALDEQQMDEDMARARVGPNIWLWPGRVLNDAERARFFRWCKRRMAVESNGDGLVI